MLINRRLSKDTSNLLVKLLKNLKRIWKYLVEIGKNKVDNWKCGK